MKELSKDPKRRDLNKAGKAFEEAVAVYPQYAAAWTLLAQVRAALGDADGARKALWKSIEADSEYMPPYQPLILLEKSRGRWQQVSDLSEKLLQLHHDLPEVGYYQAMASYFLGDLDRAESLGRLLLSSLEGDDMPEVH